MANKIYMARMGQTMKEGTISEWLKADGDYINIGDELYELEYDKASANIQSSKEGFLRIDVKAGSTVPVSSVIGMLLTEDELNARKDASCVEENAADSNKAQATPADQGSGRKTMVSAPVRRLARQLGIDLSKVTPADPSGTITLDDIEKYKQNGEKHQIEAVSSDGNNARRATPLAKKLAKELGVNLEDVVPSKGSGRISGEDVEKHAAAQKSAVASAAQTCADERKPMSAMRKAISKNMSESYFSNPVVTYTTDVDMSEFMKLRAQLNEEFSAKGIKFSVTDLLVRAVAKPKHSVQDQQDERYHVSREINAACDLCYVGYQKHNQGISAQSICSSLRE